MIKYMVKCVFYLRKMVTNLGSTLSQTIEMPGPTEQKERKAIQEEGELAAAFNLEDKEGNLNFTLLTCNLKITYLSCYTLYEI